jgi:hypothetical protein
MFGIMIIAAIGRSGREMARKSAKPAAKNEIFEPLRRD